MNLEKYLVDSQRSLKFIELNNRNIKNFQFRLILKILH